MQRFLNAISDLRNTKFSHQETQENGKSKSRSENIVFFNEIGALFDQNDQNVLHLSWILQRFLNAISDMSNIKFSHQETQESGKLKSRSGNIVFSNEHGALFHQNEQKVLRLNWILQRFLNAIPDMRNIKFSHQET